MGSEISWSQSGLLKRGTLLHESRFCWVTIPTTNCSTLSFGCVWCGSAKCRHRNCADDPKKLRQGRFNSQLDDGNETVEIELDESGLGGIGSSAETDNLLDAKSMFSSVQKVSLSNGILIGETLERIPSSFMLCCSVMEGSGGSVRVACLLTETVVPGLILDVD